MITIDNASHFFISFGHYTNANKELEITNYGSLHSGGWGDISTVTFTTRNNTSATIIIDGGCTDDVNTISNIIAQNVVDIVIFSHWHQDHVMGFKNSIATLNNKLLLFGYCEKITSYSAEPEDIIEQISSRTDLRTLGIDKQHLTMLSLIKDDIGIKVNANNVKVKLFTPEMKNLNHHPKVTHKENQLSMCTRVSLGNFKYLSMGDATADTCSVKPFEDGWEYSMIKIPHHGSFHNTNDNFYLKEHIERNPGATYIISGTGCSKIDNTILLLLDEDRNNVVLVSGKSNKAFAAEATINKFYDNHPNNFVFCENLTTLIDSNGNALATGMAVKMFEGEFIGKKEIL